MTGVDVVDEPPSTDIDQLYRQYVASQTKKNWKFYIVSCPHFMSEFDNFFPFHKKSMMFRRFLILIDFKTKFHFTQVEQMSSRKAKMTQVFSMMNFFL